MRSPWEISASSPRALCTEVTIPVGMRWIPRGMTIEYLAKAETDVIATARLDKTEWAGPENIGVPVTVTDASGQGSRARGHQHVRLSEARDARADTRVRSR